MDKQITLPAFKYHPDPLATGSIKADPEVECMSCEQVRGYIYVGPVYTAQDIDLDEQLCPWCIADGTAADKFDAIFNDCGTLEDITSDVADEIEDRTPGFTAWQAGQWLSCCDDGAAFLGLAGAKELKKQFPKAIPAVKQYLEEEYGLEDDDLTEFFDSLDKEGQPTAYVFQCLHCKEYLAYADET
ncbi:MAG TPA: CbrC family protein [Blastocatellia bacterium]